jgi:hypothetical protein
MDRAGGIERTEPLRDVFACARGTATLRASPTSPVVSRRVDVGRAVCDWTMVSPRFT